MPRIWKNGPPWRDLPGIPYGRRLFLKTKAIEIKFGESGLGQGMLEYWNVGFKKERVKYF